VKLVNLIMTIAVDHVVSDTILNSSVDVYNLKVLLIVCSLNDETSVIEGTGHSCLLFVLEYPPIQSLGLYIQSYTPLIADPL
jgi:hypothetical protein